MARTDTHDRAACLGQEKFLGETTGTETNPTTHREHVECPACGREYTYVYEFEGVFDTDDQEYLPGAVFRSLVEDIHNFEADGYDDGDGNYCRPHANRPRFERVYLLTKLVDPDSEEILASY